MPVKLQSRCQRQRAHFGNILLHLDRFQRSQKQRCMTIFHIYGMFPANRIAAKGDACYSLVNSTGLVALKVTSFFLNSKFRRNPLVGHNSVLPFFRLSFTEVLPGRTGRFSTARAEGYLPLLKRSNFCCDPLRMGAMREAPLEPPRAGRPFRSAVLFPLDRDMRFETFRRRRLSRPAPAGRRTLRAKEKGLRGSTACNRSPFDRGLNDT